MLHRIFGVILVVAGFAAGAIIDRNSEGCVLPVPRFAFFMPLVFNPTGDLIQTEHVQNVTLLSNDRVVLSCYPGYFKKMPTEQVMRASCKGGEIMGKFTSRSCHIENPIRNKKFHLPTYDSCQWRGEKLAEGSCM